MKRQTLMRVTLSAVSLMTSVSVFAQEAKVEIVPAADVVSSYVWRGIYQTGFSIQPALTMTYGGFSLGAWGSTDLSNAGDETRSKEFDLTVGYGTSGFGISVTDYWWSGEGARYGRYATDHYFEGTVSYDFGEKCPLNLAWHTMFAGGDKDEDGDRQYSSYAELGTHFNLMGVEISPGIGISPWKGLYSDGFGLNEISVKATKQIKVSDSFSLPLYAKVIAAPEHDNVFLVLGATL